MAVAALLPPLHAVMHSANARAAAPIIALRMT